MIVRHNISSDFGHWFIDSHIRVRRNNHCWYNVAWRDQFPATAGTLKGSKYLNTRGLFEDDVTIVEHVGQGFVELVENGILDGPEAESVVRASLQPLLDAGADTIVLGCTHYPFLQPLIQRLSGPGVQVIDPAPAVARQTVRVLQQRGIPTGKGPFSAVLYASGSRDSLDRIYALIDTHHDF